MVKKDIHEKDKEYLSKGWSSAAYCVEKLGWIVVECAQNGVMRLVEIIGTDI